MEEYELIKKMITGCKTKMDAINLGNELKLIHNKIFLNIINSYEFNNDYADNKNFMHLLDECNKCDYIEDIKFLLMNYDKKIDDIQLKTIDYIINSKEHKLTNTTFIEKHCPHCNNKVLRDVRTTYIVCGYPSDNTFSGCGRDWCFKCGKKLCKKWESDQLYIETNQFHDGECCKTYAEQNSLNYEDFCKCTNTNVDRTR